MSLRGLIPHAPLLDSAGWRFGHTRQPAVLRRGQALVEFALVMPVFLLIMLAFRGALVLGHRHVLLAEGR